MAFAVFCHKRASAKIQITTTLLSVVCQSRPPTLSLYSQSKSIFNSFSTTLFLLEPSPKLCHLFFSFHFSVFCLCISTLLLVSVFGFNSICLPKSVCFWTQPVKLKNKVSFFLMLCTFVVDGRLWLLELMGFFTIEEIWEIWSLELKFGENLR